MHLTQEFKKVCFRLIGMTVSMIVIMTPVLLLQLRSPHTLSNLNHSIAQQAWVFTCSRISLIFCFFLIWPVIVRHFSRKRSWSNEKIVFWLRQRWKIMLWLMLFEVCFCEKWPVILMRLLGE